MKIDFSVTFLLPEIELGLFYKKIKRVLNLFDIKEDPGFYKLEFEKELKVIHEVGEEVFFDIENIYVQLGKTQGYSQEYNWSGPKLCAYVFRQSPYCFLYIDFPVNIIAKLIKASEMDKFYDILRTIYSVFNAFGVMGDFDLPLTLKNHKELAQNFLANPDNSGYPYSLGLFHQSIANEIERQLNLEQWNKKALDDQLILYTAKDFFENIDIMAKE